MIHSYHGNEGPNSKLLLITRLMGVVFICTLKVVSFFFFIFVHVTARLTFKGAADLERVAFGHI